MSPEPADDFFTTITTQFKIGPNTPCSNLVLPRLSDSSCFHSPVLFLFPPQFINLLISPQMHFVFRVGKWKVHVVLLWFFFFSFPQLYEKSNSVTKGFFACLSTAFSPLWAERCSPCSLILREGQQCFYFHFIIRETGLGKDKWLAQGHTVNQGRDKNKPATSKCLPSRRQWFSLYLWASQYPIRK